MHIIRRFICSRSNSRRFGIASKQGLYWGVVAVVVGLCTVGASATAEAKEVPEAKIIFNQRCTACHTFGRGVKVGPDLKGVNARRERAWLLKFIRSSQTVIKGGDPVATALFEQFKKQRMPDWTDLSEKQIIGILEWFGANGPEQKEPDERNAELATAADLDRARGLFTGQIPLTYGGLSCSSCHTVLDEGQRKGGTLGPDLTTAYQRYQDRAMTIFLKAPCTKRAPEMTTGNYLTPEESFAIKAFLRKATLAEAAPGGAGAAPTKGTP